MKGRLNKWLSFNRDAAVVRLKRALPEPVRRSIKRILGARNSIVARAYSRTQMATAQARDEYHHLVAANIVNVLLKIMTRFYDDLGVDTHSIPLVKSLESFRRTLPTSELDASRAQTEALLIRFERAFALCEAGRQREALPLFETVFRDPAARKVAPYDPLVKEAVARSGEFLGRHHDKSGSADAAIAVYRDLLSIDRDGLVARRLMLLLSRRGDLAEAAQFGEMAMSTKVNLFPRLPEKNPYIAALKTELAAK